ncbi:MAG TPA: response regulator transcription factor [Acidisarcina sp.]
MEHQIYGDDTGRLQAAVESPYRDAEASGQQAIEQGREHLTHLDQPPRLAAPAYGDAAEGRSRVLLCDPDQPLTRFLARRLAPDFTVEVVHDQHAALDLLGRSPFDLLLLDLPEATGLELLAEINRAHPILPILVITASRVPLVAALDAGADDYVAKPFRTAELLARVKALVRRAGRAAATRVALHAAGLEAGTGELVLHPEECTVERRGRRIDLTPREFSILELLMRHRGSPVSRATVMERVWKAPFNPANNIVDVYMKYLRDKIDAEGEEKLIRTIRGVGYVLGPPARGPATAERAATKTISTLPASFQHILGTSLKDSRLGNPLASAFPGSEGLPC